MDPTLRHAVILAALCVLGFTLHAIQPVVVPLLLALCLVLAVQPLVDVLQRRGFPNWAAVTAGMAAVLVGLASFAGAMSLGLNRLLVELPKYEQFAREQQQELTHWLAVHRLTRLAVDVGSTQPSSILVDWSLATAGKVPAFAGHLLFVLVLTLFMLLERNAFRRKLLKRMAGFAQSNQQVFRDVQHYLAVKTLVSALTGVSATASCLLLQVPNAPLWGVLAFVLNFIPYAGSLLAAVPPLLLVVITGDWLRFGAVAACYLLINGVVGGILEPRWLGKACGLSPLVVLLSMVVWGALLGPVGALLSVPLTSALRRAVARSTGFNWLGYLMAEDSPQSERVSAWPGAERGAATPDPVTVRARTG